MSHLLFLPFVIKLCIIPSWVSSNMQDEMEQSIICRRYITQVMLRCFLTAVWASISEGNISINQQSLNYDRLKEYKVVCMWIERREKKVSDECVTLVCVESFNDVPFSSSLFSSYRFLLFLGRIFSSGMKERINECELKSSETFSHHQHHHHLLLLNI